MSAINPYAPPRARVADVYETTEAVQPVKFWSSEGRVGRLRYLAHSVVAYIVFFVLMAVLGGVFGAAQSKTGLIVGTVLATIAYLVFTVLKTIQRSHDMDWTGWSVLLAFIPLVGLIWLVKAGTPGTNQFGAPPPPNGTGVKLLALIIPIGFVVIGILAAIAIPAYQDYVQRAKAAQVK